MPPPLITIVTPSFQQAPYLEQTIDSVLSQGYPNLEYIVIDGGSTDGSLEIIKKYERHLTYWVSEKDRGQTHAINKGLARATGDVLAYINSDDYYLPGAFKQVVDAFKSDPECDLVHGRCRSVDVHGRKIGEQFASITRFDEIVDLWDVWWKQRQFVQPEVFWTRRIAKRVGDFRESLHFAMDYDYWTRILQVGGRVRKVDAELTCFRFTPDQKSSRSQEVANELLEIVRPLLWDSTTPIPMGKRLNLQGKWLFDARFRRQAAKFGTAGDSGLMRKLKLSGFVCRHPQMLITSSFWNHVVKNIRRDRSSASDRQT